MLKLTTDDDHRTTCETCGKPAVRRKLHVNGLVVLHDTHCESMFDPEYLSALERMRSYYEKLLPLRAEFKARKFPAQLGIVSDVELDAVTPSACKPRKGVRAIVSLRAFGRNREIRLAEMDIEEMTIEAVTEQLVPLLADAAREMRAEWEREIEQGRF